MSRLLIHVHPNVYLMWWVSNCTSFVSELKSEQVSLLFSGYTVRDRIHDPISLDVLSDQGLRSWSKDESPWNDKSTVDDTFFVSLNFLVILSSLHSSHNPTNLTHKLLSGNAFTISSTLGLLFPSQYSRLLSCKVNLKVLLFQLKYETKTEKKQKNSASRWGSGSYRTSPR